MGACSARTSKYPSSFTACVRVLQAELCISLVVAAEPLPRRVCRLPVLQGSLSHSKSYAQSIHRTLTWLTQGWNVQDSKRSSRARWPYSCLSEVTVPVQGTLQARSRHFTSSRTAGHEQVIRYTLHLYSNGHQMALRWLYDFTAHQPQ